MFALSRMRASALNKLYRSRQIHCELKLAGSKKFKHNSASADVPREMANLKSILLFLSIFTVQLALPSLCVAGIIEHDCACPAAHCDHEQGCETDPCQLSILKSDHKTLSASVVPTPQILPLLSAFVLPLKHTAQIYWRNAPNFDSSIASRRCAYPSNCFPLMI